MNPYLVPWLAGAIFVVTYVGLAIGKIPGLRVDRAGIAYCGAALMLCTGVLSLEQATSAGSIDYQTLFLLLGMMVVVGFLRMSGAFTRVTEAMLTRVHSPMALLAVVIVISGLLSAFLVNDVVCLALTPIVLHVTRRLRYEPIPLLIGLATASNVGSAGTITGNPQNMIIGSASGISYFQFSLHLFPVALLGLVINFAVIAVVYRKELAAAGASATGPAIFDSSSRTFDRPVHRHLQWISGFVAAATIVMFLAGLPIALVATGAAALLVLIGRLKPGRVYREIDWTLLLMFIGLFVVVHAFQMHVVSRWHVEQWRALLSRPVDLLSGVSAVLSNLVSNVPAVLLLEPLVHAMPKQSQTTAWLSLAMSSTFAGNLTVLGSVANLIVVERARREGVTISFWEYCRAGIPITLLTLGLGVGWAMVFYR